MKINLLVAAAFIAVAAHAEPKIVITSFEYPSGRDRTAEICGKVTDATLPGFVRLEVDYTMDEPAIYNVPVGSDGLFCTVAVSMRKSVRASLWGQGAVTTTATAK